MPEKKSQKSTLGEIFISIPTAQKQAQANNHSITKELQYLFVHGLLHIFGYTHETNKKMMEMFAVSEKILKNKLHL